MKVSYAITACNEYAELEQLLYFLIDEIREEDEIVVVVDETNVHKNVTELLYHINKSEDNTNFTWFEHPLNKDFSKQKNFLNSKCKGEWIIQLDSDELPHFNLINNLKALLQANPTTDLFLVPRINTVEGIGLSHTQKWGWNVSKLEGQINEKELDLDDPRDRDEYELLKKYNLIIEEDIVSK